MSSWVRAEAGKASGQEEQKQETIWPQQMENLTLVPDFIVPTSSS